MYNHRTEIRLIYVAIIILIAITAFSLAALLKSKEALYKSTEVTFATTEESVVPFPVSVNPASGIIIDESEIYLYPSEQLASVETTWWDKILAKFIQQDWYQNLASPVGRVVVIWPGERKEEVADHIGDILRWNSEERLQFLNLVESHSPVLMEGKFYPGKYVTHREATPQDVATLITNQFNSEVLERYTSEVESQVPLTDALIIASLLEREASDFENMREVAGVIWNRLFIGMPLQLDATLQYARANRSNESDWWPVPAPADKFINSPYNTYSNEGLPPAPIANPSQAAVLAALNPVQTDCYYYFHDNAGGYHCSETYEEHVHKLKATFGRGR